MPHPKLDNLVKINQLKAEPTNANEVRRMLNLDISASTLAELRSTCRDLLHDAQTRLGTV